VAVFHLIDLTTFQSHYDCITAATTIAMMEKVIPVISTTSFHLITIIIVMVEELRVIIVAIILVAIVMELLHLDLQAKYI
jgi:hypothetical protein